MASLWGAGARARGSQGRASSKLSQLVKAANERQMQTPVADTNRSDAERAGSRFKDRKVELAAPASQEASLQRRLGDEETTFYSEEEDSEDDEDELLRNATPYEEDDEESVQSRKVLFEVQALGDFPGEEDEDLGFKDREILTILESSRDDGWLLAENALGERGFIPSNYVQRLAEEPSRAQTPITGTSVTPRRGRDLWAKLRQTVKQSSLADVLSALGAVPSGFRDSTLAKLLNSSPAYHTSTWVFPKPSPTGIAFKDLKWNHARDQLQPKVVKIAREFSVIAARMIPLPGKGVSILSRHVRISVFNKNDMLSNIHTVRATWNPQEERTWKFAPKAQTTDNSLFHQTCIVRLDSSDPNVELLFELGITFKREKTGEIGELSCGWSSLPLFEHSGNPTPNKTFELKVHGGTPFESGVEVDPARSIKVSGGLLPTVLRANQTPRLYVRLQNPSRNHKAALTLLPSTLVTCSLYTHPIGCFRQLVGVAFLRGRLGLALPNYVNKTALNVFLRALDQPDVMDFTLGLYSDKMKLAKRADKQSLNFASNLLETILLLHTYPLLHSPSFPNMIWANEQNEKVRLHYIEEFSKKTSLSSLLSQDVGQTAMNISEQIFSIYP